LLVTGGAGYMGSVVDHQLVEAGHETVVLDNLSKGHRRAMPDGVASPATRSGPSSARSPRSRSSKR
ncbi:MAG TPA: NAD-dependent epimerase/dehydratase family protein, partial [Rubrobacteraceae bacterium]|nr:NAD-dependent epimerase/dehydratase family protein [Rubrobacteraceae bacterium]